MPKATKTDDLMRPIETDVWEPHPDHPGRQRRAGGRPVADVARELGARLDKLSAARAAETDGDGFGVEWVSARDQGVPPLWPNCQAKVWLETGPNEGYLVRVGFQVLDRTQDPPAPIVRDLVVIKSLGTREAVFALHRAVFELMSA